MHQHFDAMASEIHHRPASRFCFFDKPVTGITRLRIEPLKGVDFGDYWRTDLSRSDNLFRAINHWIEMSIVCYAESHMVRATCNDHPIALRSVHRHRLFT